MHKLTDRAIAAIETTVSQLAHFHASQVTSFKPRTLTHKQIKDAFWAQGATAAIELACQKHTLVAIESPYLLYESEELRASLVSIDATRSVRCCFYASSSESALTFFEVGIRPDAQSLKGSENTLRDQNKYGGEFVERLLAGEILPTFFIKFNVSQLLMAILGKAHVAEVVSSVWSEDFLRHCLSIGLEIM